MREIYIKNLEDRDFKPNQIEIIDPLQIYLNQLRILFGTELGEVMGAEDMSVNLESLIFESDINEGQIQDKVLEQIGFYCTMSRNFDTNVKVRFFKGTMRDIAVMDLVINKVKRMEVVIK